MNERRFTKYFKAFSDPTRLKILQLLSSRELPVAEIVKALGLAQPTISRHLAILREAEVVTDRREGQQVFYSLNRGSVQDCCSGFCDCLCVEAKPKSRSKKK